MVAIVGNRKAYYARDYNIQYNNTWVHDLLLYLQACELI